MRNTENISRNSPPRSSPRILVWEAQTSQCFLASQFSAWCTDPSSTEREEKRLPQRHPRSQPPFPGRQQHWSLSSAMEMGMRDVWVRQELGGESWRRQNAPWAHLPDPNVKGGFACSAAARREGHLPSPPPDQRAGGFLTWRGSGEASELYYIQIYV